MHVACKLRGIVYHGLSKKRRSKKKTGKGEEDFYTSPPPRLLLPNSVFPKNASLGAHVCAHLSRLSTLLIAHAFRISFSVYSSPFTYHSPRSRLLCDIFTNDAAREAGFFTTFVVVTLTPLLFRRAPPFYLPPTCLSLRSTYHDPCVRRTHHTSHAFSFEVILFLFVYLSLSLFLSLSSLFL